MTENRNPTEDNRDNLPEEINVINESLETKLLDLAKKNFGELNSAEEKLFKLAQERFSELSAAEYELFRRIANSKPADYRTESEKNSEKNIDPKKMLSWGEERTLRADRIRWLCTEPEVWKLCLPQGMDISGAKIVESLNLSFTEVDIPLRFFQCGFAEALRLEQAKLRKLDLSDTHIASSEIRIISNAPPTATSIDARGISVVGSISLSGFQAEGTVSLYAASIGGNLDCGEGTFINEKGDYALLAGSANIKGSVFLDDGFQAKGTVYLYAASIGGNLTCSKGTFINENENGHALLAQGANVKGSVYLNDGFQAKGTVSLYAATIGGYLLCSKGTFTNEKGHALLATSANVKGSVYLDDEFQAKGTVSLYAASIGVNLLCSKGTFINENEKGHALLATSANVKGSVYLDDEFQAKGTVRLDGASIGGDLTCSNGKFTNENEKGYALLAQGANVKGSVYLNDKFQAKGTVSLYAASIGGDLTCSNGTFTNENEKGYALLADGANITGSVLLGYGFQAKGTVRLVSASIGGNLICSNGKFTNENENGYALIADRANITDSVSLGYGFQAKGTVSLMSATIGGNLECFEGKFTNATGYVLTAVRANITGSVFLRNGFRAEGTVRLVSATIGGDLDCEEGTFINENEKGDALTAEGVNITGSVFMRNGFQAVGTVSLSSARVDKTIKIVIPQIRETGKMCLNLQFAKVQTLNVDEYSSEYTLELNGLVYEAFEYTLKPNGSVDKALEKKSFYKEQYLKWLQHQPEGSFAFQPYEQLAKVLRATGKEDEALRVLIGKQNDQLRYEDLNWFSKFWKRVLGVTIAYGYRPQRALIFALGVVALGSFIFNRGYGDGLITPTDKDCKPSISQQKPKDCSNNPAYPKFNPIIYSLDSFLPIIDLRLKNNWLPNANDGNEVFYIKSGAWLRYYFLLHIISGWVLTTLWVAGFSGIVRSNNK